MAELKNQEIPENYKRLEGSELHPSENAKLIGPADDNEVFSVTVILRRRTDGNGIPDFDFFAKTPPKERPRLNEQDFAERYGADPEDIKKVVAFAEQSGLKIIDTHLGKRSVILSGTVKQMSNAFAVSLNMYEHQVTIKRNTDPVTETYRGRDGFIYVPEELSAIIIGVFGLDNRRMTKQNSADPPNTGPIPTSTIKQLYNFPTNSASGQTIAIFSAAGYKSSDISLSFGGNPPIVTDISIDASNNGNPLTDYGETTQDICISGLAAPGANIAVYFTIGGESGWVDLLNRVIHPNPGDPVCSVFSSSFYIANADDASYISPSFISAVSAVFQDAAIQGVTICIACGDTGSESKIPDGKTHVQYPGSDPWVLSVGGTTIGNVSGSNYDEWVWNDIYTPPPPYSPEEVATGGGISDHFPLPSYQNSAGVPVSLNDGHVGRGVPDVAGNASFNAPYSGLYMDGNPFSGSGTSASSPLWAGLVATMNAAIGTNIGFMNPIIYQLGSSVFNDILPNPGAADNGVNGTPGYPAGAGWDACTGWGSPNGVVLLDAIISTLITPTVELWVDKSTFGKNEVEDVSSYPDAFWLIVDGVNLDMLASATPGTFTGAFPGLTGVHVTYSSSEGPVYELPGDNTTVQRVRFPCKIAFDNTNMFPSAGTTAQYTLTGTITINGTAYHASTEIELTTAADPYYQNIDPVTNNVTWLSQDLRVFGLVSGQAPVSGAPTFTGDPYAFMRSFIGYLNSTSAYTVPSSYDPLNNLPNQTGYNTDDTSVTPLNPQGDPNYNFAIARVRLRGSALSSAEKVRVFFRLFIAESCDTDFQPNTSYKSTLGTSGDDNGLPIFPLASGNIGTDPSGNTLRTMPFFATDSTGSEDYDPTATNNNIRTITIPSGSDYIWAYYGCFLDVYNSSINSQLAGTHHCIVAQIAYDGAPIVNANGITMSPGNSDKLAQRNLQITLSGNPGPESTHRIPQAFDIRPSLPFEDQQGNMISAPDELMIDWGNTPVGSIASIYWPQIHASDVIALADKLHLNHGLSMSDPNTIQCPVVAGVTYIPIPSSDDVNETFAGLFTVDLPIGVVQGQEFNILVRRVAQRQTKRDEPTWRYVTGAFQVKIPVTIESLMLYPEENTLAIFKWRLQVMNPEYRWYKVMQRYIDYISARVDGCGGDAASIKPSEWGVPPSSPPRA